MTELQQLLREARAMRDDQLVSAAQGCTEATCIYHGVYNMVLNERRRQADK